MAEMTKSQWEYIYQSVPINQIPWETGEPSPDLISLFKNKVIKKGMKVLDVGCGLGTQTRFMAQKGVLATGIDISETAIRKAREKLLKEELFANFVIGDVGHMQFPNSSFDFIYDRGCYHHLNFAQRQGYAKEVNRVLNPSGGLHMLIFQGAITAIEVIEHFLSNFKVSQAYEDVVLDHTNNQEVPIHLLRFKKI